MKSQSTASVELTFVGRNHVAVPAGDFAVAIIRSKVTPADDKAPLIDAETAFDDKTGLIVRYAATSHLPNSTTKVVRELVKLSQ